MKSLTKIVLSLAGAFVGAAIYANAATASPGDLDTKNIKSYVVKTKVEDANRQAQIKNRMEAAKCYVDAADDILLNNGNEAYNARMSKVVEQIIEEKKILSPEEKAVYKIILSNGSNDTVTYNACMNKAVELIVEENIWSSADFNKETAYKIAEDAMKAIEFAEKLTYDDLLANIVNYFTSEGEEWGNRKLVDIEIPLQSSEKGVSASLDIEVPLPVYSHAADNYRMAIWILEAQAELAKEKGNNEIYDSCMEQRNTLLKTARAYDEKAKGSLLDGFGIGRKTE